MTWEVHADKALRARAPEHVWDALMRHARGPLRRRPWAGGDRLKRIPRQFAAYPNLYRAPALPDGWRALYVIGTDAFMPRCVLIVWLDTHKEYDRLLGY